MTQEREERKGIQVIKVGNNIIREPFMQSGPGTASDKLPKFVEEMFDYRFGVGQWEFLGYEEWRDDAGPEIHEIQ